MSAANTVARGGREPVSEAAPIGPDIPSELRSRYEVRLVEAQGGEQRIGLFGPGNRQTPAIEISADRIVARREDAETIDSLVRIAQHNGWDRIEVDGSPEFRKAVWTAATREGLTVGGYEPTFAEEERSALARRGHDDRRDADTTEQPPSATPTDPVAVSPVGPGKAAPQERNELLTGDGSLSAGDSRLLLKVSALTEDRRALHETLRGDMTSLQREVHRERADDNRHALNSALDRALESPTVVEAFERVGFAPDALRTSGRSGEWDTVVADAIFLARTGVHRDTLAQDAGGRAGVTDALDAVREDREVAASTAPERRRAASEPSRTRENRERHATSGRRHDGEELAELFLRDSPERIATDPRLAGAMRAQSAMEQHIGEIFGADATRVASANLESRHMISDALRRGLDVSVREPTPVRQIEAMQTHPDLER